MPDTPNHEQKGVPEDGQMAERLRNLDGALKHARHSESGERRDNPSSDANAKGMALALRLASEFVAGVLAGAALGWVIDRLAGTSPWGLIVFMLFGFAAGIFNMMRASGVFKTQSK